MFRIPKIRFFLLNTLRRYRGTRVISIRECPICGYTGYFGVQMRPLLVDAICPSCGSSGRHRQFFYLMKSNQITLPEPIFHFAAESCLSQYLTQRFQKYYKVGLSGPDLFLNVEKMEVESGSVGTIIAHQVLEHVNDEKAIGEIWRALKLGGVFCFTTPIIESWEITYENPNIQSHKDRTLHFGQYDHVRFYGHDIRQKLKSYGFEVLEFTALEPLVSRYALERGETVFVCMKSTKNVKASGHIDRAPL